MNYKIVNGKVGFPTNSLGKVTSKFDDCKVNYIVIVNDIEEDKKVFSRNNYDKYYDIGIKSFNDNKNMEGIINKLLNLSDEDMNKDRFNVINNVKDFINYMDTLLVNYPRTSFNLKNRIEVTSYDLLELLFLTNIIDNRINNQKIIISKISMLDYYLEISYNKKYISFKKMNIGITKLDTIKKMVLGWIKSGSSI